MSLNVHLNPCPKCRENNAYLRCFDEPWMQYSVYKVCCPDCFFQGPGVIANVSESIPAACRYTADQARHCAAEKWNNLSFPPKQPIVAGQPIKVWQEDRRGIQR